MLTYDKNFILTMLLVRVKVSILHEVLTQINLLYKMYISVLKLCQIVG